MDADKAVISTYIETVFGAAMDAEMHVCIWTLADKASAFFRDVGEATDYCAKRAEQTDVYACMGVFEKPPKTGRGEFIDVSGICGLWGDVDYVSGAAHKKKNLAATREEAQAIVRDVGAAPSFEVMSGNGVHAYWLFDEPALFADANDRAKVATLSKRWASTIRSAASARRRDVDMVGDITRVLRVPGTFNYKGKVPKPVTMDVPGKLVRYGLAAHLEPLMVAEEYVSPASRVVLESVAHFRVDPGACVDADRLSAAVMNDQKFARTWERRREDLQDQSPSAYDMSIASLAVGMGWPDQDIVNAMIHFRRKHKLDPKNRVDYFQRTIGRARATVASDQAINDITNDEGAPVVGAAPGSLQADDRRSCLLKLSKAMGLSIASWVKQGNESANFTLVLSDGTEVSIGNSANVLNQNTFRSRVYDVTGVVIKQMKVDTWHKLCRWLSAIVEVVENIESSRRETVLGWVQQYLPSRVVYRGEEWSKAVELNAPFVREDRLFIHAPNLKKFLRVEMGEDVSKPVLWDMLKSAGFVSLQVSARTEHRVVSRTYWRGPDLTEGFGSSAGTGGGLAVVGSEVSS